MTNKRLDGSVVVFDTDANKVIPQHGDGPRNRDSPHRVDEGQPRCSLELPKIWESLLESNSIMLESIHKKNFLRNTKDDSESRIVR